MLSEVPLQLAGLIVGMVDPKSLRAACAASRAVRKLLTHRTALQWRRIRCSQCGVAAAARDLAAASGGKCTYHPLPVHSDPMERSSVLRRCCGLRYTAKLGMRVLSPGMREVGSAREVQEAPGCVCTTHAVYPARPVRLAAVGDRVQVWLTGGVGWRDCVVQELLPAWGFDGATYAVVGAAGLPPDGLLVSLADESARWPSVDACEVLCVLGGPRGGGSPDGAVAED